MKFVCPTVYLSCKKQFLQYFLQSSDSLDIGLTLQNKILIGDRKKI
jgi:hypothetical protein